MDFEPRALALRWVVNAATALTCHKYDRAVYLDRPNRVSKIVMVIYTNRTVAGTSSLPFGWFSRTANRSLRFLRIAASVFTAASLDLRRAQIQGYAPAYCNKTPRYIAHRSQRCPAPRHGGAAQR